MDPRAALITDIDTHLRHYLGQGVDLQRTLVDVRYARDVLLVCDGMAGTDLPGLARRYRQASQGVRTALPVLRAAVSVEPEAHAAPSVENPVAAGGHDAGPPQGWAHNTSGFGHSHPPLADFNLSPHYSARDSAPGVIDRQGHLLAMREMPAGYPPAPDLPWYSWRRWFTTQA